jgi:hypothetical protein
MYRLVVWREAGRYGAAGGFVPQRNLGTKTFGEMPSVGQHVQAAGETWIVSQLHTGFIYVKPLVAS